MAQTFTATSSAKIKAEPATIWAALTDPATVSKAFFGAKVDTDWRPGSPITFSGEWQGKSFEDKGEVLEVKPAEVMRFTHFSPLTGQPASRTIPAIAAAALSKIARAMSLSPRMSITECITVTSLSPTNGPNARRPDALGETISLGTPTGRACIAAAPMIAPSAPPRQSTPSTH